MSRTWMSGRLRLARWVVLGAVAGLLTAGAKGQDSADLSLKRAVEMALAERGNAQVGLSREGVEQAKAASARSRSFLLPHLEGFVSEQDQTRNLEAIGLRPEGLFRPPTLVGPFTTFDARAQVSQSIFDLSAIKRFEASKAGVESVALEDEQTAERVAAEVSRLYLNAVRALAGVEAAEADVRLAEDLLSLATRQKEAGTGTRIEETRARVQRANQKQRLFAAQLEAGRARLELFRAIGMDLTSQARLTDLLEEKPPAVSSFEEAFAIAGQSRADLRARLSAERAAELNYRAARWERLPSIAGFANYGSIGSSPSDLIPTWAAGVTVRLPFYDGGRIEADRAEARSKWRQEQIRTEDLKRQIELEVRLALNGVRLTREQVEVAGEGLSLAEQELAQAERRYRAGFTTSVEVTDAQSRLERARQNRVAALFDYNLATVSLSQAMGTVREGLR